MLTRGCAAQDEYDPIEMEEVVCRPPGFTKWDKTLVDAPGATLSQFLKAFSDATDGLVINTLSHASSETAAEGSAAHGKLLYELRPFSDSVKADYEAAADKPLAEWVEERYGGGIVTEHAHYIELNVHCETADGAPVKVPATVFKFK